jgi:hypothetical protein
VCGSDVRFLTPSCAEPAWRASRSTGVVPCELNHARRALRVLTASTHPPRSLQRATCRAPSWCPGCRARQGGGPRPTHASCKCGVWREHACVATGCALPVGVSVSACAPRLNRKLQRGTAPQRHQRCWPLPTHAWWTIARAGWAGWRQASLWRWGCRSGACPGPRASSAVVGLPPGSERRVLRPATELLTWPDCTRMRQAAYNKRRQSTRNRQAGAPERASEAHTCNCRLGCNISRACTTEQDTSVCGTCASRRLSPHTRGCRLVHAAVFVLCTLGHRITLTFNSHPQHKPQQLLEPSFSPRAPTASIPSPWAARSRPRAAC